MTNFKFPPPPPPPPKASSNDAQPPYNSQRGGFHRGRDRGRGRGAQGRGRGNNFQGGSRGGFGQGDRTGNANFGETVEEAIKIPQEEDGRTRPPLMAHLISRASRLPFKPCHHLIP